MNSNQRNVQPQKEAAAWRLDSLGYRAGGHTILSGVSWSVPLGSQAALIGPNGSGKSTLVRILMGYLWPQDGSVEVLGERFGQCDLHQLRRGVRLVQTGGSFELDGDLTLAEIVLTGLESTMVLRRAGTPQEWSIVDEWLSRVGLAAQATRRYSQASTGERTRAQIARACIGQPRILVLDEPTAGLDIAGRESLLHLISQLDRWLELPLTTLTVTHHLEELPTGVSHSLLLDRGSIAAAGPPDAVITDENLSRVYDLPIRVHREAGRYWAICHSQHR